MAIRYRRVTGDHYVISNINYKASALKATDAIVAHEDGELVGFFRYEKTPTMIKARGTNVRVDRHSRGIGTRLWEYALRSFKREQGRTPAVRVVTTTEAGERLVCRIKRRHPDLLVDGDFL
tara:strand:+ start:284283 stop:284645 length:363 start_codon:yes stop_codon:yes gene_type:complete